MALHRLTADELQYRLREADSSGDVGQAERIEAELNSRDHNESDRD